MIPELEVLYREAMEGGNMKRWLRDEDVVKDYRDCARYAEEGEEQLLSALGGGDLQLFRRYLDNREGREEAERRMIFGQGLSMGLRLGSLCVWC